MSHPLTKHAFMRHPLTHGGVICNQIGPVGDSGRNQPLIGGIRGLEDFARLLGILRLLAAGSAAAVAGVDVWVLAAPRAQVTLQH